MKVVGLGTFCLTSQVLKKMGLKETSMPFDWIFSSPEMIAHAIRDDFKEFLDPSNIEEIPLGRRPHPDLHRADNTFYRDKFGVNALFNHHDPSLNQDDYQYFVRCVARFRAALRNEENTLFVLFKHLHIEPGNLSLFAYSRLADLVHPHNLLCIEIITHQHARSSYDVVVSDANLEVGRLNAAAECTGIDFGCQSDHDAVVAVINSRRTGFRPAPLPMPDHPLASPQSNATNTEPLPLGVSPKHIDQITLYRGMLTIDGWSKSGPPVLIFDGEVASKWQCYQISRPDVAQVYGSAAADWGFSIRAILGRPPLDPAKVALIFPDGARLVEPPIEKVTASSTSQTHRIAQPVGPDPRPATTSDKRPLAVVTMLRNEPDYLPIWLHHYENQVGLDDCYVLDHASDDGSTEGINCNVIRLPASPFHEASRSALVSSFCASLLRSYEAVLYTDADEIVVADPRMAATLVDYVRNQSLPDVVTTLGMDLVHEEAVEGPLDPTRPVLSQRRWVRASQAGCKPTLIRRPYQWALGFHFTDGEPNFYGLYNFHIAYADMGIAYRRQMKRNRFLPVDGGAHHAADPDALINHIRRDTPWDRRIEVDFDGCTVETDFKARMIPFGIQQEPVLWSVPERFRSIS